MERLKSPLNNNKEQDHKELSWLNMFMYLLELIHELSRISFIMASRSLDIPRYSQLMSPSLCNSSPLLLHQN
jgi:hypothetical protein